MSATQYNLPEEVVEQVLSRLPIKSITRFKCVSKTWRNLFDNPRFINNYQHDSLRIITPNTLTDHDLLFHKDDARQENFLSLISRGPNSSTLVLKIDLPDYVKTATTLELSGSYNGILYLYQPVDHYQIVLCNPMIGYLKILPKSVIHDLDDPTLKEDHFGSDAVGFGYDFKTNDYKVVRIVSRLHVQYVDHIHHANRYDRIEVYNLSSDFRREIDVHIGHSPNHHLGRSPKRLNLNGVFYWLTCDSADGYRRAENKDIIVSFDFTNEVFSELALPECLQTSRDSRTEYDLKEFKGSIAVITCIHSSRNYHECLHKIFNDLNILN